MFLVTLELTGTSTDPSSNQECWEEGEAILWVVQGQPCWRVMVNGDCTRLGLKNVLLPLRNQLHIVGMWAVLLRLKANWKPVQTFWGAPQPHTLAGPSRPAVLDGSLFGWNILVAGIPWIKDCGQISLHIEKHTKTSTYVDLQDLYMQDIMDV